MQHLAKEREQVLVVPTEDVKARIVEDPVVLPVLRVVYSVLPNIPTRRLEAAVVGRQIVEFVKTTEERDLVQRPRPRQGPNQDRVAEISACFP
jgi:hypothetical protein